MMTTPRLDILIYAHDGRGLGHASRSVAIGMALRRLYPDLKVLFISGSSFTAELIGPVPLDWLKLPGYATRIIAGKSRGINGSSNFSDRELGELRAGAIKQVVDLYRPGVVLCDHSPRGKHRELLPALEAAKDTQWILGVRGVVGGVPQVFSGDAAKTFKNFFHSILWYGDETVLGHYALDELTDCFGCLPRICGYVSRLRELSHWLENTSLKIRQTREYAGTISIPWQGEQTLAVVKNLATALGNIGPGYGTWKIFLGKAAGRQDKTADEWFQNLSHVSLERPGRQYIHALARSKTALIYGGYNSITDVLYMNLPAVVLLRDMQDVEQQQHLQLLARHTGKQLRILTEEKASATALEQLLRHQVAQPPQQLRTVKLNGAETAAHSLVHALGITPA